MRFPGGGFSPAANGAARNIMALRLTFWPSSSPGFFARQAWIGAVRAVEDGRSLPCASAAV